MMIRIDKSAIRAFVQRAIPLARMAEQVGVLVKSQVQRRFDDQGDEEISWPSLWADNSDAIRNVTQSSKSGRAAREAQIAKDDKYEARIEKDRQAGKLSSAELRKRRTRLKERRKNDGVPTHYRAGGERLRDTGALQASITNRAIPEGDGTVRVEIGSPLERARYQQEGFETQGLNYIPITEKARKGWRESLVPGVDYVLVRGVKVPPSPFLRFTPMNRQDIRNTIVQAAQVR